ncbi:MAG: YkgJ family cysteine cluster protein [Planctomycetes bacterium]|nr:YkgJ family cysteine cluster protein [Planctomycetota bacterium]
MSAATEPRKLALAKGVRYTCKRCGDCCRTLPVPLTPQDVARLDAHDWTATSLGLRGAVVHTAQAPRGVWGPHTARTPDGACVFLAEGNVCEVERTLGRDAKPLACRRYPFAYAPGSEGKLAFVGAEFTCSAVAANSGKPLASHRKLALELLEEGPALAAPSEPVPFDRGLSYPRSELERVLDLIAAELEDAGRPFVDRLLAVVRFVELFRRSSMSDLHASAPRTMLEGFAKGVREQVKRGVHRVPFRPPTFFERMLYRRLIARACRPTPPRQWSAGPVRRGVRGVGDGLAGLSYLAGTGWIQPVGAQQRLAIHQVRISAPPADVYAPVADGALTHYFVAHVSGRSLLRPGFPIAETLPALGLLVRQFPLILLFARAACLARGGAQVEGDDYAAAVRSVELAWGQTSWTRGLGGRRRRKLLSNVEPAFHHVAWSALRPQDLERAKAKADARKQAADQASK